MSLAAVIIHGSLPLKIGSPEISDLPVGVLDTARVQCLTEYPDWKAQLALLGIVKGEEYASIPGMWVKEAKLKTISTHAEIDITLDGILDGNGDKRQRRLSVFGSTISVGPLETVHIVTEEEGVDSADNPVTTKRRVPALNSTGDIIYKTITTPAGGADRWNIFDPGVTVIDTYFQTAAPSMTTVGTAVTPTSAPTVSAWLWGSYTEPKRANFPSGWVLSNREPEQLYGSTLGGAGLWKIVDTYEYYYPSVPD